MKLKNHDGGPKTASPPVVMEDPGLSSFITCKDMIYTARRFVSGI